MAGIIPSQGSSNLTMSPDVFGGWSVKSPNDSTGISRNAESNPSASLANAASVTGIVGAVAHDANINSASKALGTASVLSNPNATAENKVAASLGLAGTLANDPNLGTLGGLVNSYGTLNSASATDSQKAAAIAGPALQAFGASAPVAGAVMGGINDGVPGAISGWATMSLAMAHPVLALGGLVSSAMGGWSLGETVTRAVDWGETKMNISDAAQTANTFNEGIKADFGVDSSMTARDARHLGKNMDGDPDGSRTRVENARFAAVSPEGDTSAADSDAGDSSATATGGWSSGGSGGGFGGNTAGPGGGFGSNGVSGGFGGGNSNQA